MSEADRSLPFDPSEFTAEELLARDYLLACRRFPALLAGVEEKPAKVTESHGRQWHRTESGGRACRMPCTITQSEHDTSMRLDPSPDESEWFDCSKEQYEALVVPPPDPDQVVEPPQDEQP
jgi:hypothetical protein